MSIPLKLREALLRARAEAVRGDGELAWNRASDGERSPAPPPRDNSLEPRGGANFSPIHGGLAELLVAIVNQMPDATVAELAAAFEARSGTATSRSGVQRALVGWASLEKSFIAIERDTPEHRARREEFSAFLRKADLSSLVFIDESFVKTACAASTAARCAASA